MEKLREKAVKLITEQRKERRQFWHIVLICVLLLAVGVGIGLAVPYKVQVVPHYITH